jgi:hypothetical protein
MAGTPILSSRIAPPAGREERDPVEKGLAARLVPDGGETVPFTALRHAHVLCHSAICALVISPP